MLRRTRYLRVLVPGLAALAGVLLADRPWLVILGAIATGIVLEAMVGRASRARVQQVADQVVAFAADVDIVPVMPTTGRPEWRRLTTGLTEVASVVRARMDDLRDERERVERVLNAIPAAVLLFSDESLAFANPAARTLFTLGEDMVDLTPLRALGVAGLAQAVDEVNETGRDLDVAVTRDGRELVARAGRIAEGEVALVVTDVTETRRLQDMRRDFVANASHELKTPVTGMQALADSLHLAMERDPERARSMVRRIQDEATRLAQLVRDLLDLTRLEEGAGDRERRRLDLAQVAARQVERLRPLAADRGVTLACDGDRDAVVIGIVEDIKILIDNLVLNAVLYNSRGGRVDVSVRRGNGAVVLQVSDTGIGIPEADQDRIFERFYRVDKARSRAAGGTGLGLSMVRHAAERHNGRVTVASVLGEGTTFTVVLPVDGSAVE